MPELSFTDAVLGVFVHRMVPLAQRHYKFIWRFLSCAAALAVGCGLHPDVGGDAFIIYAAFYARELTHER